MSSTSPHITVPARAREHESRRESRLRLRARVFLHRARLDALLAEGALAQRSAELALRSQQLLNAAYRSNLADSLDEVVCIAEGRGLRISASPPLACREVRAARASLLQLAGALREADVADPRGVALAQRLLTDGTGPLYIESHNDALWHAARAAIVALAG